MQYIDFDNELNEKQLEAVTTSFQNVRIVAGAGSGKTRVLTYRIAYLLGELHILPWKILAITFTNKVANEMKTRVTKLCPDSGRDLSIKTFHSFAAMFLRQEIGVIGYPANFNILDEEDQTKLIKDIAYDKGYRRTDPIVKKSMSYIGSMKLKEKYPDDIQIGFERFEDEKVCLEIYQQYEEIKDRQFSLDFDDLLLKTNIILEQFPDIRSKWQRKIDHILVDEFQDTNDTEYRMINFLLKPSLCLYVVGDPDQTIYTWRGANQNIILDLQKRFNDIETIVLDRNYRSTQTILDSANKLIAHNRFRIPKNLYTENGKGENIVVRHTMSPKGEADYVAREINKLKTVNNYSYSDIVILYRSNYVSLDFETSLSALRIPYVIYGGVKFYQRREIKDVICYFRLINNSLDDVAFERIINVPRRGIGESSVALLKKEALAQNLSMYEYISSVSETETELSKKVVNSLRSMITVINNTREKIAQDEEVLSKVLEDMIFAFGYYDYLIKEEDGEDRIENVKQLFADLRNYLKNHPDSSFDEYLQNIALVSAQDEVIEGDHVTLMTVHTAKGLEYPVVFVVRFNDGVFPHARSTQESGFEGTEEERRLAYVAMTRAKERLYLTYSDGYSYVLQGNLSASPFIKESGNEITSISQGNGFNNVYQKPIKKQHSFFSDGGHIDSFDISEPIKQDFSQEVNNVSEWNVGDIVIHKTLGIGKVIELEGDGIIKVNFDEHGIKSILGNHKAVSKGN